MQYILYSIFYLVSLLPLFVLYLISDFAFFLMYYVFGYRTIVVMENLKFAFPEKSEKERKKIAKEFYRNLTDSFTEMIKLFSISEKQIRRRVLMDLSICDELVKKGKSIHFHLGHQMNWEFGNFAMVLISKIPVINIYLRLNNATMDKVIYRLRSRFGGNLVAAQEFREQSARLMKNQYALGLIADQSAPSAHSGYWLHYFGRPAVFIGGPDKGGRRLNPAVVFLNCVRVKRGYYRYDATLVVEEGKTMAEGQLTLLYRDFLEKNIRMRPANYLWSHRRWKIKYKDEYKKNWVDTSAPPKED